MVDINEHSDFIPRRKDLVGMTRRELEDYFRSLVEKPYRAKQILKWIYQSRLSDFEPMTDMPIPLRAKLSEHAKMGRLEIAKKVTDPDGASKLLYRLNDGHHIEAVHIPAESRETVCLSTQVGCSLGCAFCATGSMGFMRNLNSNEIIGQLVGIEEELGITITNVVFMGMGEPLLNLPEVIKALELFADDCAFGIGHRRVTVSTVGIPKKIDELLGTGLKLRLAVSLNAPNNDLRHKLMPKAAEIAPIGRILRSASEFAIQTGRWFTVEYVLIKDVNDGLERADKLAELLLDLPCKVNLIEYNQIPGLPFKSPGQDAVLKFQSYLLAAGITATLRESKGRKISGACGMLRYATEAGEICQSGSVSHL